MLCFVVVVVLCISGVDQGMAGVVPSSFFIAVITIVLRETTKFVWKQWLVAQMDYLSPLPAQHRPNMTYTSVAKLFCKYFMDFRAAL